MSHADEAHGEVHGFMEEIKKDLGGVFPIFLGSNICHLIFYTSLLPWQFWYVYYYIRHFYETDGS